MAVSAPAALWSGAVTTAKTASATAGMTDPPRPAARDDAAARLFESIYPDLKRIAHGRLHRSGGIPDLNTTALVHESYLRLVEGHRLEAADRQAFFGYAARVMRSVVIDHLRAQQAAKRGGGKAFVTLTTGIEAEVVDDRRLLAIHDALDALDRIAPSYRELVEMRYFAGLSLREVAELRGISDRSVAREWEKARLFLLRLMEEG